jgi:hypothetical protein
MKNLAWIVVLSGVLVGASRCDRESRLTDGGVPLPDEEVVAGKAGAGRGAGAAGKGAVGGKGSSPAGSPATAGKGSDPDRSCGSATCDTGEVCCNASCGICTKPGQGCTKQFCVDDDAGVDAGGTKGESCGPSTCAAGQVCCNESCGICTKPGGVCTQQFCGDGDPDPDPDAPFCGGIAGIDCPGAGSCEDDPNDGCDPNKGGADCGGRCTCHVLGLCVDGSVWDDSPGVCACVPEVTNPCAAVLCPQGTRCELQEVQCIRAPCPPQATCVPF